MAELVARGPGPNDHWRRTLPLRPVTLGRVPSDATEWSAPWDMQISALHATLTWNGTEMTVCRSPKRRNPIEGLLGTAGFVPLRTLETNSRTSATKKWP